MRHELDFFSSPTCWRQGFRTRLAFATLLATMALPLLASADDSPAPLPAPRAHVSTRKPLNRFGSVKALSRWVAELKAKERKSEQAQRGGKGHGADEEHDADRDSEVKRGRNPDSDKIETKRTPSGRAVPFREENDGGGLDYLEAYLYYIRQRAYPNDSVDWSAYPRAVAHRNAMPAFRSNRLHPDGVAGSNAFQVQDFNSNTWQFLGPVNFTDHYQWGYGVGAMIGRVNDLQYDPVNAGTYYVATSSGGVWKTTDAGVHWTPLSDGWTHMQTSSIALQPGNSNVIYVGTGDFPGWSGISNNLMKSMDGGATWTNLGSSQFSGVSISKVLIDPENPQTVLVTTGRGAGYWGYVWRSTDGGATWTKVVTNAAAWSDLRFGSLNGATRNLYATGNANGTNLLYLSTDRGATWTQLSYPSATKPSYIDLTELATSPTAPNTLYLVSGHDQMLYQSLDAGQTWTSLSAPNGANWGQEWYDNHLECETRTIGGTAQDFVFLSLIGVFGWSQTNGWSTVLSAYTNTDPIHVDQHGLTVNPANPDEFLAGSDGGAYRLTFNSSTGNWDPTSLNATLGNTEYYHLAAHPTDPTDVIAGAQDNGTVSSRGSFLNWSLIEGGDGAAVAINQTNPLIQYSSYIELKGITVTTDNWVNTATDISPSLGNNESVAFIAPFVLNRDNQNLLYAGSSYLYDYNQPTNTWINRAGNQKLSANSYVQAIAACSADGTHFDNAHARVYTGAADGQIWTTASGGTAGWRQLNGGALPNRAITSIVISPTNTRSILVGLSGSGVAHLWAGDISTNPVTWTNVSGSGNTALPDISLNTIALDPDKPATTWYVGTDVGVFATTDGGATWSNATAPLGLPNVQIDQLVAVPGTHYLNAGTFGRGIWRLSLSAPSTSLTSLTVNPTSAIGGNLSPNVNATITLSNPAPNGGAVVSLSSSNTGAASIQSSVTVPAGVTTFNVPVGTMPVAAATSVTLTATYGNVSKTTTLTVNPASLTSVSVSPTSVIGGQQNATGTVTLNGPAPTGGAVVTLSSDTTSAATVPANVTVAAGATTATFTVTSLTVTTAATATITATYGSASQTAALAVNPVPPPVKLTSLAVTPNPAIGGQQNPTGTVTLSGAAPTGGITVTLTSSNTGAATVPASVTVAAGATTATFTVTTKKVPSNVSTRVTASYNGASSQVLLTVAPVPAPAISLKAIAVTPNPAVGGQQNPTGTVTLSGPAPTGGITVTLTSSNTGAATVPASVTVAAGATTATFTVTSKKVPVNVTTRLTAAYNGTSQQVILTVTPPAAPGITVTAISVTPNPAVGGQDSPTGTVTLSGPAPTGGITVTLTSSNTGAATVPASVTVAAGATTATFTVTSKKVPVSVTTRLTAAYSGSSQQVVLTVTP